MDAEINEEVCDYAVDEEDNPLAGTRLGLNAVNVRTRAETDFTVHRWLPLAA